MAQLYVPYALGSMAVAAVSKWLYDYSNSGEGEIIVDENSVIELESTQDITVDLYTCTKCQQQKTIDNFSKNQQKKKPSNMWKCKTCTIKK